MSEHYFSSDPTSPYEARLVNVAVWGEELELESATGVFSHGRLDPGTAVLLRETDRPATGDTFLDLGCGYGVLACALARARPGARVWAVDVNERALALARRNADRLGFGHRVTAVPPDDVPVDVRFDGIWTISPIRIGKRLLHDLLL